MIRQPRKYKKPKKRKIVNNFVKEFDCGTSDMMSKIADFTLNITQPASDMPIEPIFKIIRNRMVDEKVHALICNNALGLYNFADTIFRKGGHNDD